MSLSDAIRKRVAYFLKQKNMNLWKLFKASGVPISTLSAFMNERTELVQLDTLLHICEGLNITLKDFFDSEIFKNVEAVERKDKKNKN